MGARCKHARGGNVHGSLGIPAVQRTHLLLFLASGEKLPPRQPDQLASTEKLMCNDGG